MSFLEPCNGSFDRLISVDFLKCPSTSVVQEDAAMQCCRETGLWISFIITAVCIFMPIYRNTSLLTCITSEKKKILVLIKPNFNQDCPSSFTYIFDLTAIFKVTLVCMCFDDDQTVVWSNSQRNILIVFSALFQFCNVGLQCVLREMHNIYAVSIYYTITGK